MRALIDFVLEHKQAIGSTLLAIHAGVVHFYLAVWHAGGYRTIWRNFQGPKQPQPTTPDPK